ncbi:MULTISPECIES: ROK family transcriptional regulator [unclassified Clostridium]|jgi:putative regulator|uniref:ROK family transcriptional regulator n=1 Tax=unclassified Clostridium TaxID=2614128 RepID=UPI0025C2CEF4|nr:ROK family transcriptional regulator [Clostridium sp.]MCI6692402.1 ROK family transcriptional regulator [Clostridium sp.]MDY2632108.1 ROK family transcriptional regulator [Clostridium sp.]MDY4251392.1 ROK family transcriptional regulator [Clostridium sp.]MDY6226916.1 ROK family transcriptional regulator [Clostridium sp.]
MNSIKRTNRSRILEYIFRNAPVSRATIAEQTDITPATVTMTITELINEEIVIDLGEVEQSDNMPGRKRVLIDLNPNYCYEIGIEFNEKNISFCIADLKGNIIDELIYSTTYNEISNITEFIIKNTQILMQKNKHINNKILGIGIGVPGKINNNATELFSDSNIWENFFPKKIKERFNLPIVMDNNVKCMAMGMYLFQPKKSPENFSFFHLGIGMYCANVINGELFQGNDYISGEIGHTIVKVDGKRCECGKNGCLNTYASERWLIKTAKILLENKASIILDSLVKEDKEVNIEHIITAYNLGDEVIRQYIIEALKYLSMTISNLSMIINPTKIFLHGRLFEDKTLFNQFKSYIEKDLSFIGDKYFSNIELVTYKPINGAIGASARVVYDYFIN